MASTEDLIVSEGTTLGIKFPSLDLSGAADDAAIQALYVGATYENLGKIRDLGSPDPTRTTSNEPTLDEGEIVGSGTTTRATLDVVALAVKGRTQGYKDFVAAFKAKETCDLVHNFTDGTKKYYRAHLTGARESAPVGSNFQIAIGIAVQGEVITVYATETP